jgi:hypothetical protein
MIHALLLTGLAMATPPDATLAQLEGALERLTDPAQVQRFLVTTTARHADLDGDDAHVDVVVNELTFGVDGSKSNTKLSHTRDGEPVDEPKKDDDGEGSGFELALPAGDELPRYAYGSTRSSGGVSMASYEPIPGASGDDLARGEVAWDPTTGRPLWIVFEPVDMPLLVKSLSTRISIGETGGKLHSVEVVSSGVGGPPLLRKRFRLEMRFHDVQWR